MVSPLRLLCFAALCGLVTSCAAPAGADSAAVPQPTASAVSSGRPSSPPASPVAAGSDVPGQAWRTARQTAGAINVITRGGVSDRPAASEE